MLSGQTSEQAPSVSLGTTGLELSFDENGKARFRLLLGSF